MSETNEEHSDGEELVDALSLRPGSLVHVKGINVRVRASGEAAMDDGDAEFTHDDARTVVRSVRKRR